jgi:hypothetical protein
MDQTDGFASVAPNNARRLSETTGIIGAVELEVKTWEKPSKSPQIRPQEYTPARAHFQHHFSAR